MTTVPKILAVYKLDFEVVRVGRKMQNKREPLGRPAIKSRKENPQKLTQLSSRTHPRHLVGKRTAQKDTIIDITSDSQVNSNFPYKWSPAGLTFNTIVTYFHIYI